MKPKKLGPAFGKPTKSWLPPELLSKVMEEGGGTFSRTKTGELVPVSYTKGYALGNNDFAYKIPVEKASSYRVNQILTSTSNRWGSPDVGMWVDDGILYIEPSETTSNLQILQNRLKGTNEKGVWDWAAGKFRSTANLLKKQSLSAPGTILDLAVRLASENPEVKEQMLRPDRARARSLGTPPSLLEKYFGNDI